MDTKAFKQLFTQIAEQYGFKFAFGGWFCTSPECILVLDLQKSSYGNYFLLNLKVFVQGAFGKKFIINKDLVKRDSGNPFRRQPKEFDDVLSLENGMDEIKRKFRLESLFTEFIVPFSGKALTRVGLQELGASGAVLLLPAIQAELQKQCHA